MDMNELEKPDPNPEEESKDLKPHYHEIEANVHLGADCISDALQLAEEFLEEMMEGREFYISSVTAMQGVDVVNWPGESECDCSFCKALRSADEDVMIFDCSCGYQIRVMDDWKEIPCPSCRRKILRENVISANGLYLLIDKE